MHTGVARERRGDVFLRFLYIEGSFVVEYVGNAYFEEDHCFGKSFVMEMVVFGSLSLLRFLDPFFGDIIRSAILFGTFFSVHVWGLNYWRYLKI